MPQGKDLRPLQNLPRSSLGSHAQAAGHRTLLSAFLSTDVIAWLGQYISHRIGARHRFQDYSNTAPDTGIYPLAGDGGQQDGEIRIVMAGDWGTGTDEANDVAQFMQAAQPHFTIHLGDVYFVGDTDEVKENCLGQSTSPGTLASTWPPGSRGSFALNGNHEMYALGNAYFDLFLPTLGIRTGGALAGQKASFFALRNDYWTIVGLDTGYNSVGVPLLENIPGFQPDCTLRDEHMAWLRDTLGLAKDPRGIILLSHHQYFSAFDDWYPKPAQQLSEFLQRPVLWFWGHEHRLAFYHCQSFNNGIQAYGRCMGHGGMPVDINSPVQHTECPVELVDNRSYPNTEGIVVGYNGYVRLTFLKNALTVEYRTIGTDKPAVYDQLVATEQWTTTNGAVLRAEASRAIADPQLTTSLPLAGG